MNTTKIYTNVFPRVAVPAPPHKYPAWLKARLANENSPIPESVTEENRVKIEPWMTREPINVKIFGGDPIPPSKYVAPPAEVTQCPKVLVRFKVLSSFNTPVFGFSIRANDANLITDVNGLAVIDVYQGHDVLFSTSRESGWTLLPGANKKSRMSMMVPICQNFQVDNPTMITIYPMAGEWDQGDGVIQQQPILYTTS